MTTSFGKPMTPPKRWYQLSISQMLVAMAVVALLTAFNLTTSYHSTIEETRDGLTRSYAIERSRTGWPVVYLDTCKRIPLDGGAGEEFVLSGSGEKAINAFMIDVLVAVTVIAITVMCAEKRFSSWLLSLSYRAIKS